MVEIKKEKKTLTIFFLNASDKLVNRLDFSDERFSEFEAMSVETSQTEKQSIKELKIKGTEYPRIM